MAEIIFEKNKTYLGDCLDIMPQLPDGIFDMICVIYHTERHQINGMQ